MAKTAKRLHRRLREAVAASANPQLQRGQDDDDETGLRERDFTTEQRIALAKQGHAIPVRNDKGEIVGGRYPIETAQDVRNAINDYNRSGGGSEEKAHIAKNAKRLNVKLPKAWKTRESTTLRLLIREASIAKTGGAYEATIVREGPGNPEDRNYYTKEALREAVRKGLFEGLQGYLNHPTPTEERERPERDVRYLAGHFREARFVDGNPAEVRAKFIPGGMDVDRVVSLIESALASVPGRPLIGISIDGYGHAPDTKEINGRTYSMVREVTHLGSADIVTRAGAGGQFHRRLQEAWRNTTPAEQRPGDTSQEEQMKAAKLQEKVQAAVAKLREASEIKDDEAKAETLIQEAVSELDKCAAAEVEPEVKIQEKIVEKPVAASDDERDQLAVKLRETETKLAESETERKAEKSRRKDAEAKLAEVDKAKLAAKVLREAEVSPKTANAWFEDVVEQDDEDAMRRFVERKKDERDEILAEFRESQGVEGAGPRMPSLAGAPSSGGLLDRMGIDKDELAAA